MSYINDRRSVSTPPSLAAILACAVVAVPLPGQAVAGQPTARTGPTFGVAVGVSRVSLPSLATGGPDIAIGWHIGWQTAPRVAVLIAGSSSVYRYAGAGRPRKRGFESIAPMLEYRLNDHVRISGGAGMQLDAPVFYDLRWSDPAERHFKRGFGAVFGLSYALRGAVGSAPELRARWNTGYVPGPDGRAHGNAGALLVGFRRDP